MMRSTMTILALLLAFLMAPQQSHGLAFVALSVRTALLTKFTRSQRSLSPILYAQTAPAPTPDSSTKIQGDETDSAALNEALADYRNQMLDLVYERSMERLMNQV
jgi:hypothetical protein